jgi:hypothetical protein
MFDADPRSAGATFGKSEKWSVQTWSLPTLQAKLIKISAKVVRHGWAVTFQMAEPATPRQRYVDFP